MQYRKKKGEYMVCIEELMKKESISGEDIGKLIISNDICMYKKSLF